MPAIRPTHEHGYQHHHYVFQLIPPFSRKSGANFGPKFKPTRSIYVEADVVNDCLKTLVQRRRVDGKSMLSVVHSIDKGFDTSGIYKDEEVRDKLIRLFDHENLVRIMDIQLDTVSGQTPLAQLGFEHMSRGTLNRILFDKVAIPESLCWHVLEGVTNALLWLHYGYQKSFSEEDWNPIALINIHPGAIYFTAPRGDETYGVAKVSSFDDAIVMPKRQAAYDAVRIKTRVRDKIGNYVAPELLYIQAFAALVSDIYSLGATLYHMMLGHAPEEVDLSHETTTDPSDRDFWVRALPQDTYSDQLKRIVREMLRTSRRRRPDAGTLYERLVEDMEVWRSESMEGRRYVRKRNEEAKEEVVVVKVAVESKEGGEDAEMKVVEVRARGNDAEMEVEVKEKGKAAVVEVVDLEGGDDDEGGGDDDEGGEEEEEEEDRGKEAGRGKGKTRGGGF